MDRAGRRTGPGTGPTTSRRGPAAVVAVLAAVAVLIVSGCTGTGSGSATSDPPTTSAVGGGGSLVPGDERGPVLPTLAEPPPGFAFQDYLDLRLAIGPAWIVRPPGGMACSIPDGVTPPGTDQGGTPGTIDVLVLGDDAPECPLWRTVTVFPSPEEPLPDARFEPVGIDDSLRALRSGQECDSCSLHLRLVDLGLDVVVQHLDAGTRWMLELLSASPLHQAVSDGPLADSTDWVSASAAGVQTLVPPSWLPARDVTAYAATVPGCGRAPFAGGPAVLVGDPFAAPSGGAGECGAPILAAGPVGVPPVQTQIDGLWLAAPGPTAPTTTPAAPTTSTPTVERTGNGHVYAVAVPAPPPVVGLVSSTAPEAASERSVYAAVVVQVAGSWVQVGLGADPAVARTVLANLRPT